MRTKESWVNNVNKDASLPPELAVVEEPADDTGPAGPRYDPTCGFHGSMCCSGKGGRGIQRQDRTGVLGVRTGDGWGSSGLQWEWNLEKFLS